MKRALITGITGQDGSYLAEFLVSKGYEVHGLTRPASTPTTSRIEHLIRPAGEVAPTLQLHVADLSDSSRLTYLMNEIQPNEIYHLGAQSHVRRSFDLPEYTANVTGLSTTRLLEAIRLSGLRPRYYQASSSEMFGTAPPPQSEETPFVPQSPYGASKVYAYWMVRNYRDAYNLFAVNGILFNHESPRRGLDFVTRKIARAVARIEAGLQGELRLGNLEARRDWGYAPDFVAGMWSMLQAERPSDYVLATGTSYSVRDFARFAFNHVGLDFEKYVRFDATELRPNEVPNLIGDYSRAKSVLGWEPKVFTPELATIMVDSERAVLQ